MTTPLQSAFSALSYVWRLGAFIAKAIADGKPERVEAVLPNQLRMTKERELEEAEARAHYARRDEPTVPVTLPRIPDSGEAG